MNDIIPLAPGRLYGLANAYALDGRVSTHPVDARGYAPMNSYLLLSGREAVLIDAGLTVHEQRLCQQLDLLLPRGARLAIWSLRIGEYNSICNVAAIAERFTVTSLWAAMPAPGRWAGFRAPYGTPADELTALPSRLVRPGMTMTVGSRRLHVLPAPLRLLPTCWVYDEATRTLFTSDAFGYAWRDSPAGPWIVTDAADDPTDAEGIRRCLAGSRFWWLEHADTRELHEQIDRIFAERRVETIAPAFGCMLCGRDVVARHRQLLSDLLDAEVRV